MTPWHDKLGYLPRSLVPAALLFETFSQHFDRRATNMPSSLPVGDGTPVFGSERLNAALLGRPTSHLILLATNSDRGRLKQAVCRRRTRRSRDRRDHQHLFRQQDADMFNDPIRPLHIEPTATPLDCFDAVPMTHFPAAVANARVGAIPL